MYMNIVKKEKWNSYTAIEAIMTRQKNAISRAVVLMAQPSKWYDICLHAQLVVMMSLKVLRCKDQLHVLFEIVWPT